MQPIGEVDTEGNAAWEGRREGVEAWFSCGCFDAALNLQFPSVVDCTAPKTLALCSRYSGVIAKRACVCPGWWRVREQGCVWAANVDRWAKSQGIMLWRQVHPALSFIGRSEAQSKESHVPKGTG